MLCAGDKHHCRRPPAQAEAASCQCGAVWHYIEHDGSLGVTRMATARRDKLVGIAKHTGRAFHDVLELFTERAAIREFEGGTKRGEAEASALLEVAGMVR